MERMRVDRYDDARDFMSAAGPFLAAREAEHNLTLGILSNLLRDATAYAGPPLLATVTGDDGKLVAAAIRTAPHNMILSEVDDLAAAAALADGLTGEPLPGVVGPPTPTRAFAEAWTATHGGTWNVARNERIYRLSNVIVPPPGRGAARLAGAEDRDTVGRWLVDFEREALDEEAEAGFIERALEGWLHGGMRRFWLWEVEGRPVSLVGAGGRTPNGVRIGPVYTLPADRGHGYASRLTARVSEAMLGEGRRYCFLYTDLGNPTANHIYQAIGYEPVTDALMVNFGE
jgi:predicted GNAT family acetyltransferase